MTPPLDPSLSALAREAIELAGKATAGPLLPRIATKPDNTGGYDWCVTDSHRKIVAEFFVHVGNAYGGGYETRPAETNARLFALAIEGLSRISRGYLEAVEENERLRGFLEGMVRVSKVRPFGYARLHGYDELIAAYMMNRASPSKPSDTGSVATGVDVEMNDAK